MHVVQGAHEEHAHIHVVCIMLCAFVSFDSSPFKSLAMIVVCIYRLQDTICPKRTHGVVETVESSQNMVQINQTKLISCCMESGRVSWASVVQV